MIKTSWQLLKALVTKSKLNINIFCSSLTTGSFKEVKVGNVANRDF